MKIEVKRIPDQFNAWWVFAVFQDGEKKYSTNKPKSIYDYCKRHYKIELPLQSGWKDFEGLEKKGTVLEYEV